MKPRNLNPDGHLAMFPYPPNVLEKMTRGVTMIDMQNVNCYANINWMHELEPNKGPLREDDDDIIVPSI